MSRTKHHGAEPENGERWLLTYSDMITLLMALFMVLFSISSVNISKYVTLQQSLKAAFSGAILSGGSSILNQGSDSSSKNSPNTTVIPSIVALNAQIAQPGTTGLGSAKAVQQALLKEAQAASAENSEFAALEYRLNAYARAHGWANQVQAQIQRQGLVITVLTDNLLFASGQDALLPSADPLLDEIATLIMLDTQKHPVVVEGFTDNVPIDTPQFPSNWWLSTARANTVNQYLLSRGVPAGRLSVAGYGDQHPIASNATPQGRARNRRVEIVFERQNPTPLSGS
ncbi:MAG: OmpA family protein [Solirubrobacteraceae bacterium]